MKIKLTIAALTIISSHTFATEVFVQDGGLTVRTDFPGCTQIGVAKVCRSVLVAPAPEQPEAPVATTTEESTSQPTAAAEPTPDHITYFNFASSVIVNKEKNALDKAIPNLKNANLLVAGFADPLGSDEYNQKLVKDRAENVKKYLTRKGIPADNINAVGVGKLQNPSCDSFKSKSETIKCFAKQRSAYIFKQ